MEGGYFGVEPFVVCEIEVVGKSFLLSRKSTTGNCFSRIHAASKCVCRFVSGVTAYITQGKKYFSMNPYLIGLNIVLAPFAK